MGLTQISASLGYDPLNRLDYAAGSSTVREIYDGDELVPRAGGIECTVTVITRGRN